MADREEFEEGYRQEEILTRDGHVVGLFQPYPNFTNSLPIYYEQDFDFLCQNHPTSWILEVTLEIVPRVESVICRVTVKRKDNGPIYMDVDVWVKLVPPPTILAPLHRTLQRNDVFPNTQVTESFAPFVPREVLRQLENLPVELQVFFRVHGCHQIGEMEGEEENIPPFEENGIFFSKL